MDGGGGDRGLMMMMMELRRLGLWLLLIDRLVRGIGDHVIVDRD